MAKIRVILYKTPKKWGFKYLVNHLISIRTWSKYSHIEIHVPDEDGRFYLPMGTVVETTTSENGCTVELSLPKDAPLGTCYTSTMRGKDNGTVKRYASEVLDHPENWDYIEVEIGESEYMMMMDYMENEVYLNQGYSRWDILKFISPWHFPDNKRNICSEFVNNALFFACVFEMKGIVSPNKCVKELAKAGFTEIINL